MCLAGAALALAVPVVAQAALTVTPLTWNVIGLDSNSPATGPRNFPVGARVCSDAATTNVAVNFVWDSANANVDLRAGSLAAINIATLAPGACADAYFEVAVNPVPAAYDTTRRYHISATDLTGTASTPTPRELYVEHLISQNRNSITGVKLDGVPVPVGGAMNLLVGNTYSIELDGGTATQGYSQFEDFINFPNTVFQVLSVSTTYSANDSPVVGNPNDKLYADACVWDNHPASPTYRSCVGGDFKAGGQTVVTTYQVRIIGGGGTSQALNTLLYDFSGSSYHYNADFSTGSRVANIIDPTDIPLLKRFVPDQIVPGGTSTLTFTITNPTATSITGVNFADSLPAGMEVAATPNASAIGCGTPNFAPAATDTTLTFADATLAPNSSCIVKVDVTAALASSYLNTTGNLFINGTVDTGNNASATLTVAAAAVCAPGQTLAHWTVPATAANPPDVAGAPTSQSVKVATATASVLTPADSLINTTTGSNDSYSWSSYGYKTNGQYFNFVIDTQNFSNVTMSFNAYGDSNGPTDLAVSYDAGSGITAKAAYNAGTTPAFVRGNPWAAYTVDFTGQTNAGGNTTFRVSATGATNDNSGANLYLDDIEFTGCMQADPPPTLAKGFAPATVPVGGISTLTFTLGNALPGNVALTNVQFGDALPGGLAVAATPNAGTTGAGCTGVAFTPAPGATSLAYSAANMAPGASCTAYVDVVATQAGQFDNVSGYIGANESGANMGPNGFGTATLSAIAAPVIAKAFAASPILTGDATVLSFTVANPNQTAALTGIAFTDALPVGLTVADSSTAECGGTLTTTAATGVIDLSGATLAGAASCTFTVSVTGATAGTKDNVTTNVVSNEGGSGNSATATLVVRDLTPAIALLKQVGPTVTGPWSSFTALDASVLPQDVFFRFTVENIGDGALTSVGVVESTLPGLDLGDCPLNLAGGLAQYEFKTCTSGAASVTIAGAYVNTAHAEGDQGVTTYNSADASVDYATAALTLAKTATETYFVQAGDTLNYSYLVSNSGNAILAGPVTVSDDKATVTCPDLTTVGDFDDFFDPGESITCAATYTVLAADVTAKLVTNTAMASAGGMNSPEDSVTVPLAPDFTATKANDVAGAVALGNTYTWTVTVTNSGGAATFANAQTLLSDDLPSAGATYALGSVVNSGGTTGTIACAIVTNTLTCSATGAVSLPSGGAFAVPVTVTPTVAGALVNPRGGGTCAADPLAVLAETNEANNACAANTVTVSAIADLSITKSDGVTSVDAGASTTYTLTVTNNGPTAVTGATLTDPSAAGLTKTAVACSATPGQCVSAPSIVQIESGYALPALASGQTYQVSVSATVTATTGDVTNTATIAVPGGTTDPTPGNNDASDTDTVNPVADLAIVKTNPDTELAPGAATTYTLTVTNNGPSEVTAATVTDTAPAGLTLGNWTCAVGNAGSGGTVTTACGAANGSGNIATTVTMKSGAVITYTVPATVAPSASGTLANTATVAVPVGTSDPNPANDSSTSSLTVTATTPGSIAGFVWYDLDHDNQHDAGEPGRAGWTVQLYKGGVLVDTAVTDANGAYLFDNLTPGNDYTVRFIDANGLTSGPMPVNGDGADGGAPSLSELANINVTPGANLVAQSLPIDPSGVVYNSTTRQPIAGATVTLLLNGSPVDASYVAGGSATQTTGADGRYEFFLLPAAPAGTYSLRVTRSGYSFPSTAITPSNGSGFTGGPVTTIAGAPQAGQDTTYYLSFPKPSTDMTNNNIPLDPAVIQVPVLNAWGMLVLALLLVAVGLSARRRV